MNQPEPSPHSEQLPHEPQPGDVAGTPEDAAPAAPLAPAGPTTQVTPYAGLRYGAMRIGLLVVVGGLLYVAGLRGWLWILVTALASSVASWFLLVRQREAAARNLEVAVAAHHERRHHRDEAAEADAESAQRPIATDL